MIVLSESKEKRDTYIIPPNFIDTGSLFGGMVKLRNAIEAAILTIGITIPIFKSTFSITMKIILFCITALPVGILAFIGIYGESLVSFFINFILFLKNRRIITKTEVVTAKEKKTWRYKKGKCDIQGDFPEEFASEQKKTMKKNRKINAKGQTNGGLDTYFSLEKIENGIIYTKDKRFIKIIEVEPINFLLRSASEQRSVIYAFVSYLKISPIKLQFKVITKKADINKHLEKVKQEMAEEKDERCRALQADYAELMKRIGNREAITRRFFIIFEYEPFIGNKKNEETEGIAQLEIAARTAKNYLFQCGNKVIEHENENEFLCETFYTILNRKISSEKTLQYKAADVLADYMAKGDWEGINKIPITDFILPEYIDFQHGQYIVIDGTYYAYLIVPSDGYKPQVVAGWLSLLVNAGEGIDVDLFLSRQPKDRIQQKLGQQIRINRSKIKDASDTNTDFDDLDDAIRSGYYLKEGISNHQDFYYINIIVTITADSLEELEWREREMKKLMVSQDMNVQNCSFRQEQAFQTTLPLVKMDKTLFAKSKRNVLTLGAASCYPFTSFEMSDDNGILLGVNKFNNSLIIVDIFNSQIYKNANMAILGTSGAGKSATRS